MISRNVIALKEAGWVKSLNGLVDPKYKPFDNE